MMSGSVLEFLKIEQYSNKSLNSFFIHISLCFPFIPIQL